MQRVSVNLQTSFSDTFVCFSSQKIAQSLFSIFWLSPPKLLGGLICTKHSQDFCHSLLFSKLLGTSHAILITFPSLLQNSPFEYTSLLRLSIIGADLLALVQLFLPCLIFTSVGLSIYLQDCRSHCSEQYCQMRLQGLLMFTSED